jgi:hypothetical protein
MGNILVCSGTRVFCAHVIIGAISGQERRASPATGIWFFVPRGRVAPIAKPWLQQQFVVIVHEQSGMCVRRDKSMNIINCCDVMT